MFPSYRGILGAVAVVTLGILCGCSSGGSNEQKKSPAPMQKAGQDTPKQAGQTSHEGHRPTETAPTGVPAALTGLSAEDRTIAEKQRVCPVSGDVLGAHGRPYKVTVKGKTVFVCCEACEKPLLANPDQYLAKLITEKPIEGQ